MFDTIAWEVLLAVLGLVVPVVAAMYEFMVVGRKRLGYRVQMDTTANDEVHSAYAGALQQLRQSDTATELTDPSFVLLRIENNGATHIDTSDYAVLDHDKVGIRVSFPGRRVAGMVVTELSHDFLRHSFGEESGLRVADGKIELPKVPMNRGAHYKVLAALEGTSGAASPPGQFPEPEVSGGVKGGVGGGGIRETHSRTGTSRQAIALVCFLVMIILGQLAVSLGEDELAPLDCATGQLTLAGSTAFRPVLDAAAAAYEDTCPDAHLTLDTNGSGGGLHDVDEAASDGVVAFTDGRKTEGEFPRLIERPIAFSLFTLVINEEAGVLDLTLDQIRRIYAGEFDNWSDLNGNDVPISLVSRDPGSGTRNAFETRVLDDREPGENSSDCESPYPGTAEPDVLRCRRPDTGGLLDAVADTSGAIGYSELGAATDREDVELVTIDSRQAGLETADHGLYPFWETEYAYTYGHPGADSLAASFLRYLTNEVGQDVIRAEGHRPCVELQNPVLCQPEEPLTPPDGR